MAQENINAAFRQLVKVLLDKSGEFRAECASDCEPYCGEKWAVVDKHGGIAYEYDLSQGEA